MVEINWLEPWQAVDEESDYFNKELQREVAPGHMLYGCSVRAIGRRIDCDDVLFLLDDGTFAVVHLTFSGKQEENPQLPGTTLHKSLNEFIENTMQYDAREFGEIA